MIIIGWIRNTIPNKINEIIEDCVHEIIYHYYKQLKIILAPNPLDVLNKNTANDNENYFYLLTIFGYYRMHTKSPLIPQICFIIFHYCRGMMNSNLFVSWANSLATTNGIIIAYPKGRAYYRTDQLIEPFMLTYDRYMKYLFHNRRISEILQMTSEDNIVLDRPECLHSIIHKYCNKDEINYSSFNNLYYDKMSYKDEINYSSFNNLYCDKISYPEPVDKLNEQQLLLCAKYDEKKFSIFNNSQNISFTYNRRATIVFDIIWSLLWCL